MMQGMGGVVGRAIAGSLAWLAWLVPRSIVPRRQDWVAVLGRSNGAFVDNCKYFFIGAQAYPGHRIVYVTSHAAVFDSLKAAGVQVLRYPGLRAAWFLLRAGAAIVDTTEWSQRGRRALLAGSRVIQLWHGVGFKRIELDRWRRESPSLLAFTVRCMLYRLSGRLVRYDAVLSTSSFYQRELFSQAFLANTWIPANYPRNTFGRFTARDDLVRTGVDTKAWDRVKSWGRSGFRVVLFAPTFRDDGSHCLPMTPDERSAIEGFCRQDGIRLAFKMHPMDRSEISLADDVAVVFSARSDIYPVFADAAALITDYSSIYMDFLAADRPVLFHTPDLETYVAHRDIQFDIGEMTPGPMSVNWAQLIHNISDELAADSFRAARSRLKALAFDGHEPADSVKSILHHLDHPKLRST